MNIAIEKDGKPHILMVMPAPTKTTMLIGVVPAEPADILAAYATLEQQRPHTSLRSTRAQLAEVSEIAAVLEGSLAVTREWLQPKYQELRVKPCPCADCKMVVHIMEGTAGRDFLEEARGMRLAIDEAIETMVAWMDRALSRKEGLEAIRRLAAAIGKTVMVD